jgi:peptide/nickel transport system substrate-binding protein
VAVITPRPPFVRAALVALAALSLWLAAACGPAEDPAAGTGSPRQAAGGGEPHRGGTLVAAWISDIEGVNELVESSSRTFNDVGYQMFLHLLDEQPDFAKHPPTFEPELATSYEWSDDHLDLTFHLREDVVWSDGVPVTADDVRFTWEAQRSPEVAWPSAYMKEMIEDVEVVDPHTVIYHFSQVSPNQLLEANEGVILPEHAWGPLPFSEWRTRAGYFQEHLVVDGPFRLERWTPQQEIVLARNERYYDPDLPYLDRVVIRIIPEPSNQVTHLLVGTLHLVEQLPQPDVARVRASDVATVESFWHRLYVHVVWNMTDPRFADRRVRQALVLGVDRQQIVDTLWGDLARVADSPIIQNVWAHADGLEPWPFDPERTRALLAEAGWSDHDGDGVIDKDGVPFSFELLTNQGNQERIDAAVMIQEHLRRLGIDARPRVMEFNAMSAKLAEHQFQAAVSGWGMDTSLSLRYAFHSDSIDNDVNFSGYSNPEVDRLIEQMEGLADIVDAKPILTEIQQLIHRDQPMMFLWESRRVNGLSRRLHDLDPNLLGTLWFLRRAWLEPPPG